MADRLSALADLIMCPRCHAEKWTPQGDDMNGVLACDACRTVFSWRDTVLDLGTLHEDPTVAQEREGVRQTEHNAALGGINDEFEDLSRAEGALKEAILALPYGNDSRYYAEPGYFSNVKATVPAFEFLASQLEPRAGERLLDLGADLTWSTYRMATLGLECVAVDVNHHLTVGAMFEAHSGVRYHRVRASMADVPFRDATFDVVMAMNALHHAEHLEQVAANVARMLRDGGRLGLSEPYCATEEQKQAFGRAQIDAGISERTYLIDEWHNALVDAGLRLRISRVSDSFAAVYEKAAGGDRDPFAGFYGGHLTVVESPAEVPAGSTFGVRISIENRSNAVWTSVSQFPVHASCHLFRVTPAGDVLVSFDNVRTRLASELAPGERTVVVVEVTAPTESGEYVAQIDLVHEYVTWFAPKGLGDHRVAFRVR